MCGGVRRWPSRAKGGYVSDEQPVLVEQAEAGLRVITLNRPERLNAITPELVDALHAALDEVTADADARALILTGAGRGFCAGFDLKSDMATDAARTDRATTLRDGYKSQRLWGDLVAHVRRVPVPVIAAVNGPAAGGGFALALAADLRVASTTASFLVANVKIGLSGGEMGISYFLPRLIGTGRAAELTLTGRKVDAAEADRWGLVNRVVEPGELLPAARALAAAIGANPPFAVALTKEMIHFGVDSPSLDATLILENRTQSLAAQSGEIADAIKTFRGRS
jgi:enoyl-CoA hydratase